MSTGVRLSPGLPPIVPLIPEIDFINAIQVQIYNARKFKAFIQLIRFLFFFSIIYLSLLQQCFICNNSKATCIFFLDLVSSKCRTSLFQYYVRKNNTIRSRFFPGHQPRTQQPSFRLVIANLTKPIYLVSPLFIFDHLFHQALRQNRHLDCCLHLGHLRNFRCHFFAFNQEVGQARSPL